MERKIGGKMVRRHNSFIQPALFKRSLKEFLKETGVDINELHQWFELGWLSFDPKTQKVYDDKEYYEIMFIKGLVRLGLPKEKIIYMLSQLEKPYCYNHNDVYWDFNKNEWTEFSQVIDKYLDDNMHEIVVNNLGAYLEDLAEQGDKDELEKIIGSAQELLNKIIAAEEDDEFFPWEDIIACRNKKKSSETGEAEAEARKRLEGTIAPCPKCGKKFEEMELFYFESPEETWRHLCGRAGWIVICPDCKKQIRFMLEVMS